MHTRDQKRPDELETTLQLNGPHRFRRQWQNHLDEQLRNTSASIYDRNLQSQKLVHTMPLESYRHVGHAQVVDCAIFATPNSLNFQATKNQIPLWAIFLP